MGAGEDTNLCEHGGNRAGGGGKGGEWRLSNSNLEYIFMQRFEFGEE